MRSAIWSRSSSSELRKEGLAAYGDDGDDLMMALARKIVSGEEDDAETVEAMSAQSREAGASAEGYLADDGWKVVEAEPGTVHINGHVTTNGNASGLAAVPANRNGYSDETPDPQRSLISSAEFMAEEPAKPRGRSRKPQPAPTSLFEWALSLEQEREAELVGAGR